MKQLILLLLCIGFVRAQDKPRVFVQGKGSQDVTTSGGKWSSRSTADSHDESMEVTKNLQKECAGVIVTLVESNADYTVILNRESKHNRGLLRTNSQIQVANRLGDIIGTNATRTVGNASKDACQLVVSDWSQHGRMPVPDSPSAAPVAPAPVLSPAAERDSVQTVSAIRSQSAPPVTEVPTTVAKTEDGGRGSSDAKTNANGPAQVTVDISSEPSGADIEIDGNFVGSTPSSVGVSTGKHTVSISKSGYKHWERTLRSSTGNIKIAAALEAMPTTASKVDSPVITSTSAGPVAEPAATSPAGLPEEALIGVSFTGNPNVRHDGVEVSGVQANGPANGIDIRSGDVILALNAHYLFTIDEVRAELLRYKPGARLLIRYRRNQFISENYLILGGK
jgi:hypothetical protein